MLFHWLVFLVLLNAIPLVLQMYQVLGRLVQNILRGGGGVYLAWSEKDCNTLESLHLHSVRHKRLSPCQTFSGLLDADSIWHWINPWCHLHTWNNETVIPLNGITVYDLASHPPPSSPVSKLSLSFSCMTLEELTDGRGGGDGGRAKLDHCKKDYGPL
jgi:hypothetical protein